MFDFLLLRQLCAPCFINTEQIAASVRDVKNEPSFRALKSGYWRMRRALMEKLAIEMMEHILLNL